jgi:flagellar hook-associated protein 2
MSTVGISFGSPTSGQGFDVQSVVSQIVANLQAVETPWKNQLTSLGSEDTALTGIGNDLNTLSTALQSLTNFQGVLSEMQGSSSDTSVLELTSAASSAVAGSHTIVVSSLAQTSAYYTNDLSPSDTLAGTLSIQVGSGAAQTLTLNASNNTLSSLAGAINSGTYGVTANVITDASGSRLELTSNTSGSGGDITLGGSLSDSTSGAAVSFKQAQPGADAQLTVDNIPVTSSSNTVTNAIAGVTFQLLSASPNEDVEVQITNDDTNVESAVNSFVSAYNTVIGDLNTQEGNNSSGNPEPLFGNPTVATLQQQLEDALAYTQPANAVATDSLMNTGDTLSGSLSIQVGTGQAQTITVNPGTPSLSGLASAINAQNLGVTANVITAGNEQSLSLVNASSGAAGAIAVTSNLTDTTSGQAVTFGSSQANAVTSITQLGISVNNDGTLTLDTDTLDAILNSNYQDVANFLETSANYTSFGGNFTNVLGNLGNTAPDGVVYLALQEDATVETQLNTDVSNQQTLISQQQSELTTQLNEANETLQEIPSQVNEVNELYSAITGYNQNLNG